MLKPSLQLRLSQQLTMTPQLQQAIRLLQLPVMELQTQIQEALDQNVMLEIDEAAIVKRVQDLPGGTLRIKPINPDYDMVELRPLKEADTDNTYRVAETGETSVVRVVGKVVFYPKPA